LPGHAALVARITRKSLDALNLRQGRPLLAAVKAFALDRHSLGLGG
jgi:ABC-type molybdate transport system ATPase subunit